jgi:hypothetical protein
MEPTGRYVPHAETEHLGWIRRLLTDLVPGLDSYRELLDRLQNPDGAIKIVSEVG